MRLTIDLRFSESPPPGADDERVVTLADLAAQTGDPRALLRVLRGTRYQRVSVLADELPMSGVQAGALGLAALARSSCFELTRQGQTTSLGHAAFLARAAAGFPGAMLRELGHSAVLRRRAQRIATTPFVLPALREAVGSITYLRTEPSLRWLGAQIGGAATHTSGVINGFVAGGLDVHVYAAERPEGIEGVPFTAVPPRRMYQLAHWLTLTDYTGEIADAAQERRADIVYQRYALGSYAGLELARRLGVPLVLEFNGSEIWATKNWGSGRIPLLETLTALEHRNITDATMLVVTSDVLRDDLVSQGIDVRKILVNPNGVDVELLAPARELTPTAWRERLGREQAPTIGFIGTFGMWHGVTVLPEMIEAVAKVRPDARWVLVGDGGLRAQVEAEIAARGVQGAVDLPGVVAHEQAVELLASCDICVSPHVPNPDGTRFFGSPTKLFEYMGLGKPIVASDLEQIGEVLEHERSALLCLPGDGQAAAAAVLRLIADPQLAERLGEAALADASERYSWRAHTRRIIDALAALR